MPNRKGTWHEGRPTWKYDMSKYTTEEAFNQAIGQGMDIIFAPHGYKKAYSIGGVPDPIRYNNVGNLGGDAAFVMSQEVSEAYLSGERLIIEDDNGTYTGMHQVDQAMTVGNVLRFDGTVPWTADSSGEIRIAQDPISLDDGTRTFLGVDCTRIHRVQFLKDYQQSSPPPFGGDPIRLWKLDEDGTGVNIVNHIHLNNQGIDGEPFSELLGQVMLGPFGLVETGKSAMILYIENRR